MSADGSVELEFGDGPHKFRLALGQWRELQENINRPRVAIGAKPIGPNTLMQLLRTGDAWIDDVREVVRLGLVGGGMKPLDALTLVKRYVDARPLLEVMNPALVVVVASLVGVPDDLIQKKAQAETAATGPASATTTESPSPQSMELPPRSDGPPNKPTAPPFGNSPPRSRAGIVPTVPKSGPPPQVTSGSKP